MKDIIAAFLFFTRLPLWRTGKIPADSLRRIVAYWPLTGLLTGGLMVAVYFVAIALHFHAAIAVLMAFISRILITGALHEDGLADFLDGFGGGRTREQILSIMKDPHTGSYGILGLALHVVLWTGSVFLWIQQTKGNEAFIFFTCDAWSKWCASQITNLLPYARKEEESKIKETYENMSPGRFIAGLVSGILPFVYFSITGPALLIFAGGIVPVITLFILVWYMKRRIRGYTGDCCGAAFLVCELSYLLALNCLWKFT